MQTFQLAMFFLCAFGGLSATVAQSEIDKVLSESKADVQAQIETTIKAFLSADRSESEIKTNWKGYRELARLKGLAKSEDEIVKQLAIYAVVERDEEDLRALKSLMVLQLLNLKPSIPIRVLAPHLDSGNQQLREFSEDWFESHDICAEGPSALLALNYADYVDYVRGQYISDQKIPGAFIDYLYERSPDRALLVFYHSAGIGDTIAQLIELRKHHEANKRKLEKEGRGDELAALLAEWHNEVAAKQGKDTQPVPPPPPPKPLPDKIPQHLESRPPKEILLSEHIISNVLWLKENKFDERFKEALPEAKQHLAKLAESDRWWARLYVAKIMQRHLELRVADVFDKLKSDEDVSRFINQ